MATSDAYGVLIGLGVFVLLVLMPQPVGSATLGLLFAVHYGMRAILTWRRTKLRKVAASLTLVAALSALVTIGAAGGYSLSTIPTPWAWFMTLLGGFALFLLLAESVQERAQWEEYRRKTGRGTLWTILSGRDIPDLRSRPVGNV